MVNQNSSFNANSSSQGYISQAEKEAMQSLKMETAEEIGLLDKLSAVGNDPGQLTPKDFGKLGGNMSRKLTAMGKQIYNQNNPR